MTRDYSRHIAENISKGSALCPFGASTLSSALGGQTPVQQAAGMTGLDVHGFDETLPDSDDELLPDLEEEERVKATPSSFLVYLLPTLLLFLTSLSGQFSGVWFIFIFLFVSLSSSSF